MEVVVKKGREDSSRCAGGTNWADLEQFRPMLARFLSARCRDHSESEDLVQETLLRAARYRARLQDRARLRAWVMQIAANVFRDHVRRARRGARVGLEDDVLGQLMGGEVAPGDPPVGALFRLDGQYVEGDQLLSGLGEVFPTLMERDQKVLRSYYSGGEDTARTARECDIDRSLVKVRLFRARRRLERSLRLEMKRRRHLQFMVPPG